MSVDTSQPPKLVGDELETETCNELSQLTAVDDEEADWHDARLETPLTALDDLRLIGRAAVPSGRPVEIKACQQWVTNGDGSRQRGRWYLKHDAHEKLAAAQGIYVLLVYDGDTGDVLGRIGVPARIVSGLAGTWSDVSQTWGSARVAKLSWSRLLDPDSIGEEGR